MNDKGLKYICGNLHHTKTAPFFTVMERKHRAFPFLKFWWALGEHHFFQSYGGNEIFMWMMLMDTKQSDRLQWQCRCLTLSNYWYWCIIRKSTEVLPWCQIRYRVPCKSGRTRCNGLEGGWYERAGCSSLQNDLLLLLAEKTQTQRKHYITNHSSCK